MSNQLWVLGIGSIVAKESAEKTVRREISKDDFHPVEVRGYSREWTAAGGEIKYHQVNGKEFPGYITYLNMVHDVDASFNGIVFPLSQKELKFFRKREHNYDMIDVSTSILSNVTIEGTVYGFSASDASLTRYANGLATVKNRGICICKEYMEKVEKAFESLGGDQLEKYKRTTKDPDPKMPILSLTIKNRIKH